LIGRWLTEGETVVAPGAAPVPIVASDVYQWAPGGHFVMHPAYGRIGNVGVGGLEIIGYDPQPASIVPISSIARETFSQRLCRAGMALGRGKVRMHAAPESSAMAAGY